MDTHQFLNSGTFNFIILPLLIFAIRIIDVSMGTLRIIFISRDIRVLSAVFGFFEVLIWLFAISHVMRNLNSPVYYVAYAAGFSMGTFVGVTIERAFSYGNRIIQIITNKDSSQLVKNLREREYGVTGIAGEGVSGPVRLIFTVVKKNKVGCVLDIIRRFDSNAFYTIEDVKYVRNRYVPALTPRRDSGKLFQKRK